MWAAVQTLNQLIATQLDSTELNSTEKLRIKSKQNLSVSLSPEVWQKCFVDARSRPISSTSCRSVIASDLRSPIHWTNSSSVGGGDGVRGRAGPSLKLIGRSGVTAVRSHTLRNQCSCRLFHMFVFISRVRRRLVHKADWLPCCYQFKRLVSFIFLKDHTCVFVHVLAHLLSSSTLPTSRFSYFKNSTCIVFFMETALMWQVIGFQQRVIWWVITVNILLLYFARLYTMQVDFYRTENANGFSVRNENNTQFA